MFVLTDGGWHSDNADFELRDDIHGMLGSANRLDSLL